MLLNKNFNDAVNNWIKFLKHFNKVKSLATNWKPDL